MKNYIDLHIHSKYSDDGEYTPAQLVEMCAERGIRIMALADHNTAEGVLEAKKRAEELGICLIPAVEIDCTYRGVNLHVVGYGIDEKSREIRELYSNIYRQEKELSMKKVELTRNLGFEVTKEELDRLSDNGVYTGEMFGEVILAKKEYADHALLKPYRNGGSRSDNPYVNFYWDFYAPGKTCYTEVKFPTLEEIVRLIHQQGGKAVLAHPGINLKNCPQLFDEMMKETPLDGVEAFSNYHDEKTVDYYYKKGKSYKIMITCGSDFHGKTKPSIGLGECRCPYDEEFIEDSLKKYNLIFDPMMHEIH